MKHTSKYLEWYIHVPKVKYDFRSSGLAYFKHTLNLGEVDLSVNYTHGNPETTKVLAERYNVKPENVFVSTEGASGQNARIVRCLAEKQESKREAIVEYPTYEPLLRQVEEYFPRVKRLERKEEEGYCLNADALKKVVTEKTGLLVLTNPHAPSGAIVDRSTLKEIMEIAGEFGFFVLCDEIYAEFDRKAVPSAFAINSQFGIVTTSFTKAYGLGGIKLGVALARNDLVDDFYKDVLNTVGNSSNIAQHIAKEVLKDNKKLELHKQKWMRLEKEMEEWLNEKGLQFFPNKVGVTYWVESPIGDTYKWTNQHAIPHHNVAPVPGTFFLFKNGYEIEESNMIRIGLGNINPDSEILAEALEALEQSLKI